MSEKRLWEKAVARIDEELTLRGFSKRQLCLGLGRADNYLKRTLEGEKTRWDVVFEVLEYLDIPAGPFFDSIHEARPHRMLEGFTPPRSPVLAKQNFLNGLERLGPLLPLRVPADQASLEPAFARLAELEDRRHTARTEVEEHCETKITQWIRRGDLLTDRQAILAVGMTAIWGTIRRKAQDLGSARRALSRAIYWAEEIEAEWLVGRTLQRASYVLRDLDRIDFALLILDRAAKIFWRLAAVDSLGQVLVDRANFLFNRGSYRDSENAAMRSLEMLWPANWRHRASAFWVHAQCCCYRGDLKVALNVLREAIELSKERDPRLTACHQRTSGDIAMRMNAFDQAAELYRGSMKTLEMLEDPEGVVVLALDLTVALKRADRESELGELGATLGQALCKYAVGRPGFEALLAKVVYHLEEEDLSFQQIEALRCELVSQ